MRTANGRAASGSPAIDASSFACHSFGSNVAASRRLTNTSTAASSRRAGGASVTRRTDACSASR